MRRIKDFFRAFFIIVLAIPVVYGVVIACGYATKWSVWSEIWNAYVSLPENCTYHYGRSAPRERSYVCWSDIGSMDASGFQKFALIFWEDILPMVMSLVIIFMVIRAWVKFSWPNGKGSDVDG